MIREFEATDIIEVNAWLREHAHPTIDLIELPKIGYIIPGVACGFLRLCEGGAGIIESMATNPKVPMHRRGMALYAISATLIHHARSRKIHKLIAFSSSNATIKLGAKQGFYVVPQTVLARSLS